MSNTIITSESLNWNSKSRMSKNIYIGRGYTDGITPYWEFGYDKVAGIIPNFYPYYTLFANNELDKPGDAGGLNLDDLLRTFEDTTKYKYPKDSMVIVDLEGDKWRLADLQTKQINETNLEKFITIAKALKLQRPDCKIGWANTLPIDGWLYYRNLTNETWFIELNKRLSPLAEYSDFIMFEVYPQKKYDEKRCEDVLLQIRNQVYADQIYNKEIIPLFWPIWTRSPESDEAINPRYARAILEQLTALGIDSIALWGERGHQFNPKFDWLVEIQNWAEI